MRSKHEIPNKFDYMKAYSYNLVLTERTNCELENEKNVGKIDSAFYRNFSWQIMGKKKERQLSQTEAKDVAKIRKQETLSEAASLSIGRLQENSAFAIIYKLQTLNLALRVTRLMPSMTVTFIITVILVIATYNMIVRYKLAPAKIKKCSKTNNFYVKVIDKDIKINGHKSDEDKVVRSSKTYLSGSSLKSASQKGEEDIIVARSSKTDFSGNSPKRYTSTCYFKARTVPAWFTESLLLHIGSTKRKYDEKVWFKTKLQPYYWSENMTTEVNVPAAKSYVSEVVVPTEKSSVHYISLEQ